MKLAIGNDHAAVELKFEIMEHLKERGIEVVNVGTDTHDRFNYPVAGYKVAKMVAAGEVDGGVLIFGTGVGISLSANKVKGIRKSMDEGKSFADAIGEADIFSELHVRMIKMGSATGREDQVLGKLSNLYEEEVEESITHLVSIIEPTLVAMLTIVIGAVLLAVILPMAGILSSL